MQDNEQQNDNLELDDSDSPDYSSATVSSDNVDDVEDFGDEEVEDDGEEVVFDEPSILNEYGLTEEEMAEIDELDEEPEFDTSILEELEPNWRDITEDTVEFMLSEHSEQAGIAAQHAILHLAVEQIQEELGEDADDDEIAEALETYDFSEHEPFYDAVKFGYLMGIEAGSRRIVPQFIEAQCVGEYVSEAAEQYSDYVMAEHAALAEDADNTIQEMADEGIAVVESMLQENASLQTKINILEANEVVTEECRDLTMIQRSEIQSLLEEMPINNDTFNLSDYRSKVVKLKSKYKKPTRTGLLDTPSYSPKSATNSKLMNGVEDALRKTRR